MRRPASQPPELPGYTYVKLLGSGGFSDVFLYDQKLPKRAVAVKVLLTEEITAASRAAFVAEANLMAQLSAHPYIVTIYQADVSADDRPYFVMEYCSGPSLGDRYKNEKFAVEDALRTGVRLSSAVATAHAVGILHRDIKPANVLSNDYGWPALTDFGISSAVDDEALPIHTSTLASAVNDTGTATGTGQSVGLSVPWSPPEMFEEDPHPDVRSDVFSLAATIYTILAGQSPFEVRGRSNGTLDLMGRIERGAITPMERTDIPRSLLAVLQKGMASNPDDRFPTAVDFARALQRVELELGYTPTSIEVPNLRVAAPERPTAEDGGDETRVRSVATIEAQPAAPSVMFPPPPARATEARPSSDDATMVRGARTIDAQPRSGDLPSETVVRRRPAAAPEEPEAAEPETPTEPRSRVRRIVIGLAAAAAVLIAVSIVLGIVFFGAPTGPEAVATPSSTPGDGAIVLDTIPSPTLGSVAEKDGGLVFTIVNPSPESGDGFVWKRTDRTASEPLRPADGDTVVIPDYTAGSSVCIEVSIRRGSQVSPVPLEECYPA